MASSTTTSAFSAFRDEPDRGPTRQRLDALWERHRSRYKRLVTRPVSELSLRASFHVRPTSVRAYANEVPAGTIPDCASCTNLCCAGIENLVSLRLVDVATLIDIGRTDLISRTKPRFTPRMMERRPALFELMGSELWRTLPVLRQVGPERRCAALTDDDRCGIHPHWPTSCDRFPYTMIGRRKVVWGSRCPSKRTDPSFEDRRQQMFERAIDVYNERIRDAVLLHHARQELEELGIGAFLIRRNEDPFEPPPRLPIY